MICSHHVHFSGMYKMCMVSLLDFVHSGEEKMSYAICASNVVCR